MGGVICSWVIIWSVGREPLVVPKVPSRLSPAPALCGVSSGDSASGAARASAAVPRGARRELGVAREGGAGGHLRSGVRYQASRGAALARHMGHGGPGRALAVPGPAGPRSGRGVQRASRVFAAPGLGGSRVPGDADGGCRVSPGATMGETEGGGLRRGEHGLLLRGMPRRRGAWGGGVLQGQP